MCSRDALCVARSSAILYSAFSGLLLDRLRVLRDSRIPVARRGPPPGPAEGAPGGAPRDEQRENDSNNKPVLQHRHSMLTPVQSGLTCPRIPGRTCESSSGRARRRTPSPPTRSPIRTRRYCPAMMSPSWPRMVVRQSLKAASLTPPFSSSNPMYFSGIGGGGGGPSVADRAVVAADSLAAGPRRRRWRRRFHVEPERIPFARLLPRPGLLQCPRRTSKSPGCTFSASFWPWLTSAD